MKIQPPGGKHTYTDAERLVALRAAYMQVLATGEEVEFDGFKYKKTNLSTLANEITALERRIDEDAGLDSINYAEFEPLT